MTNHNRDTNTEDAPDIINGESEINAHDQFADTDEMYAVGRSYKRESEAAAELASTDVNQAVAEEDSEAMDIQTKSVLGWIGIVLAFASFFFWPLVLSISGIIMGAIAKKKDAQTLGNIALIASIASLAYFLILTNIF